MYLESPGYPQNSLVEPDGICICAACVWHCGSECADNCQGSCIGGCYGGCEGAWIIIIT